MYSLVRATAARKSFFAVRCFTLSLPGFSGFRGSRSGSGCARRFSSLSSRFKARSYAAAGVAVRHIGRHHQPNLLAHMVEGKHLVEEEQASVGNAQLILRPHRQPLDLAHGVVGKKAHGSGGERRQPLQPRRLVPAERLAQHGKDVAFNARGLAALGDGDLAPPRHDALERREPDEGVTAHLLAALHRFQQKALALRPRRAQKGRDRRFQVGHQGAADGNERMRPGERQKLLAAGPGGMEVRSSH